MEHDNAKEMQSRKKQLPVSVTCNIMFYMIFTNFNIKDLYIYHFCESSFTIYSIVILSCKVSCFRGETERNNFPKWLTWDWDCHNLYTKKIFQHKKIFVSYIWGTISEKGESKVSELLHGGAVKWAPMDGFLWNFAWKDLLWVTYDF